jgi:hypothetical protein
VPQNPTDPNWGLKTSAVVTDPTDPDWGKPRELPSSENMAPKPDQPAPGGIAERFLGRILPSTTPSDYVAGPLRALTHPIDSAKLIYDAVKADPVGAVPVVGPLKRGVEDVAAGNYAGAAGDVVSATLPFALKGVRAPTGRLVAGVGSIAEDIGSSKPAQYAAGAGAYHGLMRGNVGEAAAAVAAPYALRQAGKGLKLFGRMIQPEETPPLLRPPTGSTDWAGMAAEHPNLPIREMQSELNAPAQRPWSAKTDIANEQAARSAPAVSDTRYGELRDTFGGRQGAAPATAPKPRLSAEQMVKIQTMIQQGMDQQTAYDLVTKPSSLSSFIRSDADVAGEIAARNKTGRW